MYVIDVIPLAMIPRNQAQLLSYFHSDLLAKGAVVEVPLNKRKIKGVVLGGDTIKNRKLTFKKSVSFELKNIARVINPLPQVFDWQFRIAGYLSTYYYAPLGICLKTVLPPFWGKKKYESSGEIEKHLKSGRQVFLMTAEKTAANYFFEKFRDLNPGYVSSGLPIKEHYEIWQNVASGKTKLIIGTRTGLFLPFSNLGLIIIDDESNEAHKSDMTPRYHAADLAGEIAKIHSARLILGSLVPRLETYYRIKPSLSPVARSPQPEVISIAAEIKAGNFSIFSRDLQDVLLKIENLELKIILYIPRRGHANFTLCQTCGQPLTCPNCSASLIPHENPQPKTYNLKPVLVCHHCNQSQPYPKQCPACGSYKLKAYGIGLEKVIGELKKFFQYQNIKLPEILRLDSDWVKTEAEENKVVSSFQRNRGAIMVATQMIFSHKHLISAPIVGIINADTLINVPDFRAEESLFRQIYTLRQMAGRLIVQTHNPDDPAIKSAAAGQIEKFFDQELESRREFNYPPFSSLVKLSYRHKDPNRGRLESSVLAEKLKTQLIEIIGPAPAFVFKERGLYHWLIILKLKNLEIRERNDLLRLVPSGWLIDIDPKNVI